MLMALRSAPALRIAQSAWAKGTMGQWGCPLEHIPIPKGDIWARPHIRVMLNPWEIKVRHLQWCVPMKILVLNGASVPLS